MTITVGSGEETPTPADLIKEHNDISDYLTAETKRLNDHLKPARERLAAIEAELQTQLLALNGGDPTGKKASLKTDNGTAYLSTIMTPKVLDKEKFLDWTLDNWPKWGAMLQIGAPQKDTVREYMDENAGSEPPFVKIENFTRINIRRS